MRGGAVPTPSVTSGFVGNYSGFDSALLRSLDVKWHFPQPGSPQTDLSQGGEVNATLHDP